MKLTMIAAVGRNWTIGTANGLPWHLPADLRRFRAATLGKPVVMGRKTFATINRVLPGRANIVLTRQRDYAYPGVQTAVSPEDALAVAGTHGPETMIIGGAEVYRAFFPQADAIILTVIDGEFAGTAWFPAELFRSVPFAVKSAETFAADDRNAVAHTVYHLGRSSVAGWPEWPGEIRPNSIVGS